MANLITVELGNNKISWFDKASGVNLVGGHKAATLDTDTTDITNVRRAIKSGDLELTSGTLPAIESSFGGTEDVASSIVGIADSSLAGMNPDVVPDVMTKVSDPTGTKTITGVTGKRHKVAYIYATSKGAGNADVTITLGATVIWSGYVDTNRDCGQNFKKAKAGNTGDNLTITINPVPAAYFINFGVITE